MSLSDVVQKSKSTQEFVPIKEIKNNTVVLKDGTLRAVVMVSSVNFGLKSNDEKIAIISAFQNFLNAIDFTVQIFIQSRRLNIRPYVESLEKRMAEQTNELLKIQIKEYIEFIKFYTSNHNVMTKSFFVVVPYEPAILSVKNKENPIFRLFGSKKSVEATRAQNLDQFNENLEQLNQRINVVRGGLSRVGLRSEILGTEELIELYFKIFNPGEAETPHTEEEATNKK